MRSNRGGMPSQLKLVGRKRTSQTYEREEASVIKSEVVNEDEVPLDQMLMMAAGKCSQRKDAVKEEKR